MLQSFLIWLVQIWEITEHAILSLFNKLGMVWGFEQKGKLKAYKKCGIPWTGQGKDLQHQQIIGNGRGRQIKETCLSSIILWWHREGHFYQNFHSFLLGTWTHKYMIMYLRSSNTACDQSSFLSLEWKEKFSRVNKIKKKLIHTQVKNCNHWVCK